MLWRRKPQIRSLPKRQSHCATLSMRALWQNLFRIATAGRFADGTRKGGANHQTFSRGRWRPRHCPADGFGIGLGGSVVASMPRGGDVGKPGQ